MTAEAKRLRELEVWIGWIRLTAVVWAVVEVGLVAHDYPQGYEAWAWTTTAVLAVGAVVLFVLARRERTQRGWQVLGLAAVVFDAAVIYAYLAIYSFEQGIPTRALIYLVVIEAAVRFGIRGGLVLPVASAPLLVLLEWSRADRFPPTEFDVRHVTVPFGIQLITGLIVGGLVVQLRREARIAGERAAEAEQLRDAIGRHADRSASSRARRARRFRSTAWHSSSPRANVPA